MTYSSSQTSVPCEPHVVNDTMTRCGLTFMQVSNNFVRTILVVDTLMRREGLPFTASDLLNVFTNLNSENHYLRLRNSQQPWSKLVTENPNKDLYFDKLSECLDSGNAMPAMTGCGPSQEGMIGCGIFSVTHIYFCCVSF